MLKKIFLLAFILKAATSFSQTTAMDWTRNDCSGNSHHLFSELESGKCVVLVFDMVPTCQLCIDATNILEPIVKQFADANPNKINLYSIGYTNTYDCPTMQGWESDNNFHHDALFINGATEVNYYGGMGMPTIVVVSGSDHKVYYKNLGFHDTDTSDFKSAMTSALSATTGIDQVSKESLVFTVYPNPVQQELQLSFTSRISGKVRIMDIIGVVKMESDISDSHQTLNVSMLSSGVYFIEVRNDEGTLFAVQRIVKN